MLHFDLDDVIHLERLLDELKSSLPAAVSSALGRELRAECDDRPLTPAQRGPQITSPRRVTWRLLDGATGVQIAALATRYLAPAAGEVDATLEIAVVPASRLEARARLTLLGFFPALGLVIGLVGWRLLQFDTAMMPLPWAITGILVGALCALALLPSATAWIAGLFEGPRSAAYPRQVKRAQAAVRELAGRLIDQERAQAAQERAAAPAAAPPAADPLALAAYANELSADPAQAILKFGLWRAENQRAIAAAFAGLQTDMQALTAYQQARRPLGSPAADDTATSASKY